MDVTLGDVSMALHVGEMGYNYNPSLRHHVYKCILRVYIRVFVRQMVGDATLRS